MNQNKHIVMVMGKPNTGKTTALRTLPQNQWAYLNTDLKEAPFKNNFAASIEIANAPDVLDYVDQIEGEATVVGGVLDTLTFLMSMYERQLVITAKDTQKAWGNYGNFYRDFIHRIKAGTKNYAILAHADTFLNEQAMQMETRVPVKGAVGKTGVEADFTTILESMQMPVKKLEGMKNNLLHITPEEQEDGVKYVFCTRVTKETAGSKMRSPMGLWDRSELYIDNDLSQVFNRLDSYYHKG